MPKWIVAVSLLVDERRHTAVLAEEEAETEQEAEAKAIRRAQALRPDAKSAVTVAELLSRFIPKTTPGTEARAPDLKGGRRIGFTWKDSEVPTD